MITKELFWSHRYESRYLMLILSILMLCILDSHFTIQILQLGGIEANPIMQMLMQKNLAFSLVFKYLITAGGLIFLLIHRNFLLWRKIRVSGLIYAVFVLYLVLILSEARTYIVLSGFDRALPFF